MPTVILNAPWWTSSWPNGGPRQPGSDVGGDVATTRRRLAAAGVVVEPVTAEDAVLAGALRRLPGGSALSLGDRLCLALTARSSPAEVLTADREWALLDLPVTVRLIR